MEQIDISSNVQIPHSYPSMPTSFAPQDNLAYILGKAAKVPFHGSFANARDQKCRLLALPTEIRQQIFSYVLPYTIKQEKRTGQSGHDIVWCRSSTALFAASKQLHQECSTLLYGDAMFDVSVWYDSIRLEFRQLLDSGLIPKTTPKFLETVLPRYWQYVRNLRVTINIEDDYTGEPPPVCLICWTLPYPCANPQTPPRLTSHCPDRHDQIQLWWSRSPARRHSAGQAPRRHLAPSKKTLPPRSRAIGQKRPQSLWRSECGDCP